MSETNGSSMVSVVLLRLRRWRVRLSVVIGGIGLFVGWMWSQATRLELPPPNLGELRQEVRSAIEVAQQSVRRTPRSGRAWGRLGMILYAHELPQEALVCLREAARLDAADFRWPYLSGVIVEPRDRETARKYFQLAADRAKTIVWPQIRLAELALDVQDWEAAERHLALARQLAPDEPRILYRQAQLRFLRGEMESCVWLADQAKQGAPRARGPLDLLTSAHALLGHRELATEFGEQARRLPLGSERWFDPVIQAANETRRDPAWLQFLAQQAQDQGEVSRALELLEPLWRRNPEDTSIAEQLARSWLATGNRDQAAFVLRNTIQRQPAAQNLWRLLASIQLVQEEWPDAIQSYRHALELLPTDAAAHEDLSFGLEQSGELDQALHHAQEALRLRPDRDEIKFRLVRLLHRTGQNEDAARLLRELQDRRANSEELRELETLLSSP